MDTLDAIRGRRSIRDFRPEPIPTETIQRLLEFGIWAPNHRLTEPWRFTIIGPETKAALSHALAEDTIAGMPSTSPPLDPDRRAAIEENVTRKFRSKPSVVAVTSRRSDNTKVQQENLAAVAAAIENVQLAAWAQGIGIQWATGPVTHLPDTFRLLGADPSEEVMVGFLYLGIPAAVPPLQPRRPIAEVVRITP